VTVSYLSNRPTLSSWPRKDTAVHVSLSSDSNVKQLFSRRWRSDRTQPGFSSLSTLGQNVRRTGRLRWAVYSPRPCADARAFRLIRSIFFQFDDGGAIPPGNPAADDAVQYRAALWKDECGTSLCLRRGGYRLPQELEAFEQKENAFRPFKWEARQVDA